jgi:3-deoxy-D-manno-octulosonate 8-phosphate phosphatase KdsC-like HAD superfamily phosphatase
MGYVSIAIAPADAHPSALAAAHIVTNKPGGRGAIREIADNIMKGANRDT